MPYDFRRSGAIDPSVLGLTQDELERMDHVEQEEALVDALNRAADLATEIVRAFKDTLGDSNRRAVEQAAKSLQGVARKY